MLNALVLAGSVRRRGGRSVGDDDRPGARPGACAPRKVSTSRAGQTPIRTAGVSVLLRPTVSTTTSCPRAGMDATTRPSGAYDAGDAVDRRDDDPPAPSPGPAAC